MSHIGEMRRISEEWPRRGAHYEITALGVRRHMRQTDEALYIAIFKGFGGCGRRGSRGIGGRRGIRLRREGRRRQVALVFGQALLQRLLARRRRGGIHRAASHGRVALRPARIGVADRVAAPVKI